MCGIVGYIGDKTAWTVLMVGLTKLEYRGYDSAGVAIVDGGELHVRRRVGKLRVLDQSLTEAPIAGRVGIGHTRWATHGEPTETNAHPHRDCADEIAVVHNGIIENYDALRVELEREGHQFRTQCDTEVIAHLIEKHLLSSPSLSADPHPSPLPPTTPVDERQSGGRERGPSIDPDPIPLSPATVMNQRQSHWRERAQGEGRQEATHEDAPSPARQTLTHLSPAQAGDPKDAAQGWGEGRAAPTTRSLPDAVRAALRELQGSFALAIVSQRDPDQLIAARRHSPLLIGLGEGENFIASDMAAVLHATRRSIMLDDDEMAIVTRDRVTVTDLDGIPRAKLETLTEWDSEQAERGGYEHFMLKEIHEQPEVLRRLLSRYAPDGRRVVFEELGLTDDELRGIRHVIIAACGTSWHAGLIGRLLLERLARVSVATEVASEFRYRYDDSYSDRDFEAIADDVLQRDTLVVAISQSGETADTLAGIRQAREYGLKVLSLVNVPGSTLARESDGVIYLNAGPEIGVASTKAYTAQLAVLYLLSLYFAQLRGFADEQRVARRLQRLSEVATLMDGYFANGDGHVREAAERFHATDHFLFIGRGFGFPTALEGALKLKEISYAHAEGYPAGELKHGPIALVDEKMCVVAVAPNGSVYEKMVSNVQEVKARRGRILAVATDGNQEIARRADSVLTVPEVTDSLAPFLTVLPLQLLAYHIAVRRGCDVDQPRNLAKSVTVE